MSRLLLRLVRPLVVVTTLAVCHSLARAGDIVDALAGRYSHHFKNGDVQGETYWSDDVVEVVPVGGDAAYIRVELNFYNGHTCSVSGVGELVGESIVYNDHSSAVAEDPPCILSVSRSGDTLLIDDAGGSCKAYCGARGSLTKDTLPWSSRRPITYMSKLKASQEYIDALHDWQSRHSKP